MFPSLLVGGAEPDLILHRGNVVTVDEGFSRAEAIAITGDRLSAVGTNDEILALAGEQTRLVDLNGQMVLPGLIDSHVHPSGASTYEFDHPVPDVQTIADVLSYIASRAAVVPVGKWIRVEQMFITRLAEKRFPTRQELDQVAPRHPVVYRTGPDLAVNSLALELSEIDETFELPADSTGKIERDADGRLTGIIRGAAEVIRYEASGATPAIDERANRLRALLRDYNVNGITSISDRNADDDSLELYQLLRSRGELTCRVFVYYGVDPAQEATQIRRQLEQLANHPLHDYSNELWLRGVKVFLDGGMLTGSAYMREPWGISRIYSITDPEYRGTLKISPERLAEIAKIALENELQMTAHAVGDGAVHNLIDAYRSVNQVFPVRPHRPCITHCNFMSREAIDEMQRLGIVADLQPAWLWLDGATLYDQFGAERLRFFQPYQSLFNSNVVVGGGSDHMQKIGGIRSVNPYNPFLGMWITLRRLPRGMDQPLHVAEALSREQAIRLYTINNAYLTFEESQKGSIEVGKLADLIVIDRDLLTCPVDAVRETQVLATYVGGKLVYSRSGGD